jgi:hypothetical protein
MRSNYPTYAGSLALITFMILKIPFSYKKLLNLRDFSIIYLHNSRQCWNEKYYLFNLNVNVFSKEYIEELDEHN